MSCRAPGRTCCAGRSRSPRAWAATRPRCCSRRPSGSSRWNADLARETYLNAWMAALFAGRLARRRRPAGGLPRRPRPALRRPTRAGRPAAGRPRAGGHRRAGRRGPDVAAGRQRLRRPGHLRARTELRWGWLAQGTASALWDDDAWRAMLVRQLRLARDAGALERLPLLLASLGTAVAWTGDFAAAAALVVEAKVVCEATGSRAAPFTAMVLAALRGLESEAAELIEATIAEATAGGQGIAVAYAHWTAAILANGLGRYGEALAEAAAASEDTATLYISMWALPELIEAAVRTGQTARRRPRRSSGWRTCPGRRNRLRPRDRGPLPRAAERPETAEGLYREAIDRLGRTRLRPELARAHLLFGEWLRRENRRVDARAELRAAHDLLDATGMAAFAERARRELLATGETARRRTVEARQRAHRAGGAHRPAGRRGADQPGDRRPAVPVRAYRGMAPAQGVRQARRRLPPRAAAGDGRPRPGRPAGPALTVPGPGSPCWRGSDATSRSAKDFELFRTDRGLLLPVRVTLTSLARVARRRRCRRSPR